MPNSRVVVTIDGTPLVDVDNVTSGELQRLSDLLDAWVRWHTAEHYFEGLLRTIASDDGT